MSADFVQIQTLARNLAGWCVTFSKEREKVERGKMIIEMLQTEHPNVANLNANEVAWQIEDEFEEWKRLWKDISINGARLQNIEEQLRAGWALTVAWGAIISDFSEGNREELLDELFGCNVADCRLKDEVLIAERERYAEKMSRWIPLAIFSGAMLVAVGLDHLFGSPSTGATVYGTVGLCGSIAAWYMRKEHLAASTQIQRLKAKWNDRYLENWEFIKKYYSLK